MRKKKLVDFVIMCGGFGKRLRPFTYSIPKPFLTAHSISPAEYIINQVNNSNYKNNLYASIFYKKNYSKNWFKKKKIKSIKFLIENQPLGTAGCLKLLLKKKLNSKLILLINGDLFAKINFDEMINYHIKNKKKITVGIKNHETVIPYSVVSKSNAKLLIEKPKLNKKINAGIYIIDIKFIKKYFSGNANSFVNMPDVINSISSKQVSLFNIGKKWIDIGSIMDFKKSYEEIKYW